MQSPQVSFRRPFLGAKALICVLAIIIAALDFAAPADFDIASLYFICVVMAVWTRSVGWLWGSIIIFVLLTFAGLIAAQPAIVQPLTWVDWLNRSLTAAALSAAAVPVHLRLRSLQALGRASAERDRAQQELQQTNLNLEARSRELQVEIDEKSRTELELRQAEQSLRQLSVRLIDAQEEERRRIARELHDSVGQYLVYCKMSLESWAKVPDRSDPQTLSDIVQALDKCLSETRTISHLLHPPALDHLGLAAAAEVYIEGFSRRSGIRVNSYIPRDLMRLSRPLELVLFRILQESLTNALRHAHSETVDINLEIDADRVALEVRDHGKGMPPEFVERLNTRGDVGGVGLSGMRERVLELKGSFEVQSDERGTIIRAVLPVTSAAIYQSDNK